MDSRCAHRPSRPHISACGGDFNKFCEKVGGEYSSAERFRPISLALSKTRSAFRFVAWESTSALSGSFWVYRIQLSLPRVISCHPNNHSAHPVRQWPESRVAYPTKAPHAVLENGKTPWRTFLDSKHLRPIHQTDRSCDAATKSARRTPFAYFYDL